MSSEPAQAAIQVEKASKLYHLYDRPIDRLKHTLFWRFGRTFGHPFWALQGVSFTVQRGETFGVIGRNGSGKSTLLQILAGILTPTEGQVKVNGRVAALLELGSGFNPEFTGRENVFLNGMILGIPHAQLVERFAEIAAFADIGDFIDQPVKIYSSGMFVRLAFAVATGVDADIILIDEALAVGDLFFRQKCYRRLEDLRRKGVSIILVSHAMNEVEQFCDRALLLNEGQPVFLGSAIEAVKRYYLVQQIGIQVLREPDRLPMGETPREQETASHQQSIAWPGTNAFLDIAGLPQATTPYARCTGVAVCNRDGQPSMVFEQGEIASFFLEFAILADIAIPIGGVEIVNEKGAIVHGKNSLQYDTAVPFHVAKGSRLRFQQDVALEIAPGEYSFNLGLTEIRQVDFEKRALLPHPELDARIQVLNSLPNAGRFAVVHRRQGTPIQLTHYGLANLPGRCSLVIVPPTDPDTP